MNPIHLNGSGLMRRELHHIPGGALGQFAVVWPEMPEVAPSPVGWLARCPTGRVGLVLLDGDYEERTLAYRALHARGWRYDGRSLMGGRCWWAPGGGL